MSHELILPTGSIREPLNAPAFLPAGIVYELPKQQGLPDYLESAFNQAQKDWILERDRKRCVAPFIHTHSGGLHIHHILPQGWNYKRGYEPDYPENGITICQGAHYTIHPEMAKALIEYRKGNKQAFHDAHDSHNGKDCYWVDKYDLQMMNYTREASKMMGRPFPQKNGKHHGKI